MSAPLRVLIVEDSRADAEMLLEELRRGGYDVAFERVEVADDMISALEREDWNLVLTDYNLPRFSGLEALAVVQERGLDLPVIIVSGALDEDTAVTALHLGATDYVMKRKLGRLVPAVHRALREAEERRVRQEAEEALRQSEERYRELVENANDVVFTTDLAGNFTSLNAAGEQITGYSRDEMCRMNMADILDPEGYQLTLRMIRQKLTDRRPTRYELEVIARDGHRVPLELSTRLICQSDAPVGVQGIARDITERRKAEEERRTREQKQAAMAQLGQHALASNNLDALFDDTVACVAETLGLEYCSVLELLPGGSELLMRAGVGWRSGLAGHATVETGSGSMAGYTVLTGEPVVVEDLTTETRFAVPVILGEHSITSGGSVIIHGHIQPFGVLSAFSPNRRALSRDDVHFLQSVANLLALAVERKRMEEERARHAEELATRVLQAQEEERKRIARELHDETAQTLSVLLAHLDLLERHMPDDAPARAGFQRVAVLARRALDETRALSHDLRPTILDDAGLVAALEWIAVEYEETYGGSVHVDAEPEPEGRLSTEIEIALFRIAQEALTNSGKHAAAQNVRLSLCFTPAAARLVVEDDGRGFDRDHVPDPTRDGRLGLYGMHERASLLGGQVQIISAPGKGTRTSVEIPLISIAQSSSPVE